MTGTNTRAFLKNMDNKSAKNQTKAASSSYPPRNSSSGYNPGNAEKMGISGIVLRLLALIVFRVIEFASIIVDLDCCIGMAIMVA